jgi:hypothetical protein
MLAERGGMGPGGRQRSLRGDAAINTIAGFAVALAVYAIAFSAFMLWSAHPDVQHNEAHDLGSRSDNGIATILSSSGLALDPNDASRSIAAWYTNPDHMTRFGLTVDGQPGKLDLDKMRNLTKGAIDVLPTNGYLDYGEAKAALGLGDYDFHLRTYPLLPKFEDLDHPVRNLRVAYVGDFTQVNGGGGNGYNVAFTATATDKGSYVQVDCAVTNDGVQDATFQVDFFLGLKNGNIDDTENSKVLAGNGTGTQTMSIRLYKTSGWDWGNNPKQVTVTVSDTNQALGTKTVNMSAFDMTAGSASYALVQVDATRVRFGTTDVPQVAVALYDGVGKNAKDNVDLTVTNAGGGQVFWWHNKTAASDTQLNFWSAQPAGWYTASIALASDPTLKEDDGFQVTNWPGSYQPSSGNPSFVEQGSSVAERAYLAFLVAGWNNKTYDLGGDVYPDIKGVMNNDLATNLSAGHYDALVVGSNVDQNAMTSGAAKFAVRDFVLSGHLLIVFGSQAQTVTWLQPLFHSSLITSGNGIGTPDPTHPILHTPEELSYTTYPDNQNAWTLNDQDAPHFTDVIIRDGTNKATDVLAVSKPGHFGNGTIVLSGWEPYALTQPQDPLEAMRVLYNFLEQGLGALYVDFGPSIPPYAEVASSSRLATADNPVVAGEQVLVRMVLYVFR